MQQLHHDILHSPPALAARADARVVRADAARLAAAPVMPVVAAGS